MEGDGAQPTLQELADAVATLKDRAHHERVAQENSWLLLTATVVFLMQYGFALLESGMCRKNNTTATYTKNILDATLGSMVAVAFGYEIAYGISPNDCSTGSKLEVEKATRVCAGFFHHLVFQATAATIVSGAMAERTTIGAYSILSAFISGIPFSLAVRWTWGGGWLNSLGFHDFAGGAVVHLVGGAAAIAGVLVVGPREGRYDPRRFYEFMPHDVSSVMSGSLVLWVGWYGFNMGSVSSLESIHAAHAAANAAVTTTIAGSMGALTAVLLALLRGAAIGGRSRSVDAVALANGLLSGLVAITAGSDVFTVWGSVLVGVGSAGAYMFASALSEAFYLDDVVEAGAVHAGCGAWSVIGAGFLHPHKGLLYTGNWSFLCVQLIGVVAIGLVSFTSTLLAAMALHHAEMLRVGKEEEAKGLDHKFGIAASSCERASPRLAAPMVPFQSCGKPSGYPAACSLVLFIMPLLLPRLPHAPSSPLAFRQTTTTVPSAFASVRPSSSRPEAPSPSSSTHFRASRAISYCRSTRMPPIWSSTGR